MTRAPSVLPHESDDLFLTYTGMETDLLFTKGADLPGFASYPLLEKDGGRELLRHGYADVLAVGQSAGVGVILESTTWLAHRDRGADIGYDVAALRAANLKAMAFLAEMRATRAGPPVLLSANVGPRDDAYQPSRFATVLAAQAYHSEQIDVLAQTAADLISGYTLADPVEAAGLALAARDVAMPVVIAFTVETDGRLPTGQSVAQAIAEVDAATDGYVSYFMVNCAHTSHVAPALEGSLCSARVRGVVANASKCSHAELDAATVLDSGDPVAFGLEMAALARAHPQLKVLGGCCGTDMRHLREMLGAVAHHQNL